MRARLVTWGLAASTLLLTAATAVSVVSPARAATSTTVTFTPSSIGAAATEIPNAMRGQYVWMGQAQQPASYAVLDGYERDRVRWGALEPTRGTYDFTWIENGLAAARAKGGRFGFRVMAWCPGCWMDNRDDVLHTTPSWLPTQGTTGIPDWNSEGFLTAWEDLVHAIAARFGDDPALGWVEVGGYGKYGEWHVDREGEPATVATKTRIIAAVHDAFPLQHVVINAMDPEGVDAAMAMDPAIGLRADCLGAPNMYSMIPTTPSLQSRWRTAPVMTEWCHAPGTSTTTGAAQVRTWHVSTVSSGNTPSSYAQMSSSQQAGWRTAVKSAGYRYELGSLTVPRTIRSGVRFSLRQGFHNVGSAPTYDAWRVELRLLAADGHVVSASPLNVDLRTLLSGNRGYSRGATLTAAPGSYRLGVAVVDPRGYLAPMRLATHGRTTTGDGAGTYVVGTVRISS